MDALIKIDLTENYEQVVSARELHQKLGIGKDFTSWFKQQAQRLGLKEGLDFTPFWGESTGGRPGVDYLVKIDTAKHLCMVSGGHKANQIREYFIQVERAWNSPDQVMARALQLSHKKIISLQEKLSELLPKAEAHDVFLSANNAQPVGIVAKILGTGRNRLFQALRDMKILMKSNVPYQEYIDAGYFVVIEKPITMGAKTINKPQTYITAKGIDWLTKKIKDSVA